MPPKPTIPLTDIHLIAAHFWRTPIVLMSTVLDTKLEIVFQFHSSVTRLTSRFVIWMKCQTNSINHSLKGYISFIICQHENWSPIPVRPYSYHNWNPYKGDGVVHLWITTLFFTPEFTQELPPSLITISIVIYYQKYCILCSRLRLLIHSLRSIQWD